MIFKDIDRARLLYLMNEAVGSAKLKAFLDDSRIKLTAVGAPYHKRKRGAREDFDFLIHLPTAAEPIVAAWLKTIATIKPLFLPEALIAQFRAVEEQGGALTKEQRRDSALQALWYLVAESHSPSWAQFLAAPIGTGSNADPELSDELTPEPSHEVTEQRRTLDAIADSLFAEGVSGASNDLERLIAGFIFLEAGDVSAASRFASAMSHAGAKDKLLAAIVRRVEATAKSLHVVQTPAEFHGADPSLDQLELLGASRTRNSDDAPAFIRVTSFRFGDAVYKLSEELRARWLEGQPEVIAFPNTKGVRLPRASEMGLWVVEKFDPVQANKLRDPIKYRVKRNGRPIYTVIPLHADPQKPDDIREAIRQAKPPLGARPIFLLADGTIVRLSNDVQNVADYDFEEPLELYRDLKCWDVGDAQIALGPLPPVDDYVDCSDITSVLKRLLRSAHAQAHLPKMTQAHIQALMESLRADPGTLTAKRLARVEESLSELVFSHDRLGELIPTLMATGEVRAEINAEKKILLDAFVAEESKLRADRDRLTKEISELNRRRLAAENEAKAASGDIRKKVRGAFEKARAAGVETLADVAVLSGILESERGTGAGAPTIGFRRIDSTRESLSKAFTKLGATLVTAKAAELFVGAVCAAGVPLVILGPLSAQYALAIGRESAADQALVVEIPIGIADSSAVAAAVANTRPGEAIVVLGCNASPYEMYGASLTERILTNLSSFGEADTHVVFGLLSSPIGLPISVDLQSISLLLDTRWLTTTSNVDAAITASQTAPLESDNVLIRNALDQIATSIASLDDPFRTLASGFLARQPRS